MRRPPDLTEAERAAARAFRDAQQADLERSHETDPPSIVVPPFVRNYRHPCAARGGRSVSFPVPEVYVWSPELWICYCSAVGELGDHFPHDDCDGGKVAAPARRFGFIYKQGHCSACKATARSRAGRLVDASFREPLGKAVDGGRQQAGARPDGPGQRS